MFLKVVNFVYVRRGIFVGLSHLKFPEMSLRPIKPPCSAHKTYQNTPKHPRNFSEGAWIFWNVLDPSETPRDRMEHFWNALKPLVHPCSALKPPGTPLKHLERPWHPLNTFGTPLKLLSGTLIQSLENHWNAPETSSDAPETLWNIVETPWRPLEPPEAPLKSLEWHRNHLESPWNPGLSLNLFTNTWHTSKTHSNASETYWNTHKTNWKALERSWNSLERPWSPMERRWNPLANTWNVTGILLKPVEHPWSPMERSWNPLECPWNPLKPPLTYKNALENLWKYPETSKKLDFQVM